MIRVSHNRPVAEVAWFWCGRAGAWGLGLVNGAGTLLRGVASALVVEIPALAGV